MNKTIEYYNNNAEEFVSGTINADMSYCRDRFLKYIPKSGLILDAGCGSGRDTIVFLSEGYYVNAFDASPEICRIASEKTGINVQCMRFEDLSGEKKYDGIWACASLLHEERGNLQSVMQKLTRLLKNDGVLYASFKYGATDRIKNGRYFCDMTEVSLTELVQSTGLKVLELYNTTDVRPSRDEEKWINVIARKV